MQQLLNALAKLNVEDNSHWTSDGLPRLAIVSENARMEVSRDMLQAVAPGFTRTNTVIVKPASPYANSSAYSEQELLDKLVAATIDRDARQSEVDLAQVALKQANDALDVLIHEQDRRALPNDAQKHIQDYLASSNAARAERLKVIVAEQAERTARQSPLDKSLSQKKRSNALLAP